MLTNGELARIPFSVGPNEYRNFTLRLTNVILVRADASQVFGTTVDGAVAVNQIGMHVVCWTGRPRPQRRIVHVAHFSRRL